MTPRARLSSFWVALAWGLNISGLLAILAVVALYIGREDAQAANAPTLAPGQTVIASPSPVYF